MRKIYKYVLKITDDQYVLLPKGAKPLSVDIQEGNLCLWAEVNTSESQTVNLHVRILATGESIPETQEQDAMRFIGTFQNGWFVGHVYAGES
jgi:hypothetical protein